MKVADKEKEEDCDLFDARPTLFSLISGWVGIYLNCFMHSDCIIIIIMAIVVL